MQEPSANFRYRRRPRFCCTAILHSSSLSQAPGPPLHCSPHPAHPPTAPHLQLSCLRNRLVVILNTASYDASVNQLLLCFLRMEYWYALTISRHSSIHLYQPRLCNALTTFDYHCCQGARHTELLLWFRNHSQRPPCVCESSTPTPLPLASRSFISVASAVSTDFTAVYYWLTSGL